MGKLMFDRAKKIMGISILVLLLMSMMVSVVSAQNDNVRDRVADIDDRRDRVADIDDRRDRVADIDDDETA